MTIKAMLLAAGRGERMRPLTDSRPKPLLEVGGKPLIVWHIERLAAAGVVELVINHAHLGVQIEAALGAGTRWGVRIRYSPEGEALETAGGIAQALPLLGGAPFLAVSADTYCAPEYAALAARADALSSDKNLAHLLLVPNPPHHAGGDFSLDGARVRLGGADTLTYAGIGAFHPALFAHVPRGAKMRLRPLLERAAQSGQLGGERFDGVWLDIGTPQRLDELDRRLRRGDA